MPIPPAGVREEAQRGLDWRNEYRRGGTPVGWARARDLANGVNISDDTIQRMVSYFARHKVDSQGQGYKVGSTGYPSAGRIAWALWGGDAGQAWAASQSQRMENQVSKDESRKPARLRKLRITRVDRVAAGANPDAHVLLYKRADELDPTLDNAEVIDSALDTSAAERPDQMEPLMTIDREALTAEVVAFIESLETERDEALVKASEAEAAIVAEPAAEVVETEPTDEEVLKALDPAVRDRIQKAETDKAELTERIAKMEDDALKAQFIAKAAEYKVVESDGASLAALMGDVAKNCAPESAQALERVLKAASARLDEAHRLITAEFGSAAGLDSTDAGQQIESLAKARATETGETMPVATAAVLNANPHLYEQARAQRV